MKPTENEHWPDAPDIGPIIQRERKARHLTLELAGGSFRACRARCWAGSLTKSNPPLLVL